jgi:hypothetical protein
MASPESYQFDAVIYRMGPPRCVDVPAHISEALGGETYIPVVVRAGEATSRTTLSPRGGGQHRLFVSSDLRRASGRDIGDAIHLIIHRDTASREAVLPDDVRAALEQRPGAIDAFLRLSPSGKRWFVNHIESAKTEATRLRRIKKDIELIIKRG